MRFRSILYTAVFAAAGFLQFSACDVGGDGTCSVLQLQDGSAQIVCDDGSVAVVSPKEGGCTVATQEDGTHVMTCPDGTQVVLDSDDISCSIVENEDGTKVLACEDGTEIALDGSSSVPSPTGDGSDDVDEVTSGELTADEEAEIETLRAAIEQGLDVGEGEYVEKVTLTLQSAGVVDDYESAADEGYSGAYQEATTCPFLEHYDNGFQPSGVNCDFLVELAKLDAYAALTEALEDEPLEEEVDGGNFGEQANFWYEQGAISGIEQRRVLVRADLHAQALCEVAPTPYESAYDKGFLVGSTAMADAFNDWLSANGHVADYPEMSQPIDVCNVDESTLDPARQDALAAVPTVMLDNPLCPDFQPFTQEMALEYAQANIEFEKGIKAGVEAEYALATVRIFRVVPCNVSDPLVIDLDGDGVELLPVYRGVNFDFYATGRHQAVAWVSPDDGLLAIDLDADGAITTGLELFGNVDRIHADGFDHLAELDDDGDGFVTPTDGSWNRLVVWQDANTDGVSQPDEVRGLSSIGIEALPVQGAMVSMQSGNTRIPMAGIATGSGASWLLGDALLQTAPWASPSL